MAPPGDRAGPRQRLRDAGLAVTIHISTRLLSLAVLLVSGVVTNESGFHALTRWDASWYRRIAQSGYGHSRIADDGRTLVDYAFFPLYPGLERALASLAGIRIVHAGLVISSAASVAAAIGIFMVGSTIADRRTALTLVALWSALPVANVLSMAYPESLFTAFAAWSLYFTLTQRFLPAGALALLAGLTRPLGVAVALAVWAGAAAVTRRPARAHLDPAVLVGVVIAPLGTVAYLGFVAVRQGSVLGYFAVTGQWHNGPDGGVAFASWIISQLLSQRLLLGLLLVGAVWLLLHQVWILVRDRYPLPLVVFTAVSVLVTLAMSGYFGSKPRYLLPVFPLLVPLASSLQRLTLKGQATILCACATLAAAYGSVWLLGAGPP